MCESAEMRISASVPTSRVSLMYSAPRFCLATDVKSPILPRPMTEQIVIPADSSVGLIRETADIGARRRWHTMAATSRNERPKGERYGESNSDTEPGRGARGPLVERG